MKHSLTSVALLALMMGCDSTGDGSSEDPGNSTANHETGDSATTHETGGTGTPNGVAASVTGATGSSFSAGSGDASTITGGPGGGQGGSGGEGGSAGEHGIAGEAGAPNYPEDPYPAVAMTRARRQALLEAMSGGAVSTTGSVQDDPDDLWVVIADTALVCSEFPPFPSCGGHWNVDFMLPRSMQQVGTYELEWFGAAYSGEAEDPDLPDVCGGGGGSASIDGRIVEVLEINASEIRFRLHSDPLFIDDDINGIYTVPLCP